jgi:hypothetical protein
MTRDSRLLTTSYSEALFKDLCSDVLFIDKATIAINDDDYLFCELEMPYIVPALIENIIVYRWNRDYPADVYFDSAILKNMKLIDSVEFKGYSHEKIIKEVYKLEEK